MALSATGYTASGAGTTATNGNYVPVVGGNATLNGATQYTNGTDFLVYGGSGIWFVSVVVNFGSAPLYNSGGGGGSTTNMPFTGWVVNGGTAPAPTFVDMAVAPGSISGISIISGISTISF